MTRLHVHAPMHTGVGLPLDDSMLSILDWHQANRKILLPRHDRAGAIARNLYGPEQDWSAFWPSKRRCMSFLLCHAMSCVLFAPEMRPLIHRH